MSGSSIKLHRSWFDYQQPLPESQRRSADAPLISILTWISLVAYLAALAMTQTNYYLPFMNVRWIALGLLAASTLADWILVAGRGKHRDRGSTGQIMTIYLLATFGTVIYAENWMFSGMRWASHAAMLSVCVMLLPQLMIPNQTKKVLSIIQYVFSTLLVFSWIRPIIEKIPDSGDLYHGAMGNANTMGHIAFIAGLLFLHGALTTTATRKRVLSTIMVAAAAATVWQSGARSSIIAFCMGVMLLFHYYRKDSHRYAMIAVLFGGMLMAAFPNLPGEIARFIVKTESTPELTALNPMRTRVPVWSAAYEGFKQRPLLGWGFGAASNVLKKSDFQLTSFGMVERDAVNDFMFMMEGCGIIGIGAYILLIYLVIRQSPGRSQKLLIQRYGRNEASSPATISLHHAHVLAFVLSVCLILLNQMDNSALSAGNLISVTLWLSVGCAAVLRHEIT
ncbi:MAG: O-antigen ligase family protein [Acidobacteria bacterium]|nr:O-antigen ligase family protein [Acidobacteriota bacterium]